MSWIVSGLKVVEWLRKVPVWGWTMIGLWLVLAGTLFFWPMPEPVSEGGESLEVAIPSESTESSSDSLKVRSGSETRIRVRTGTEPLVIPPDTEIEIVTSDSTEIVDVRHAAEQEKNRPYVRIVPQNAQDERSTEPAPLPRPPDNLTGGAPLSLAFGALYDLSDPLLSGGVSLTVLHGFGITGGITVPLSFDQIGFYGAVSKRIGSLFGIGIIAQAGYNGSPVVGAALTF